MVGNPSTHANICGCYYTTGLSSQRYYLPQVELSSHTTILPLCFTTKLTQTFVNPAFRPVAQARYAFPLYDGVAVTAFSCTIGEHVIVGRVEQKDDARQTFQNAVDRGESAGLLESLPLGVFAVTLGNIPAESAILVEIKYGGVLKHDAEIDGLRFILPTSIAPRYGEYPGELLQWQTTIANGGMRITVDVDTKGSAIRKIQTPSKNHPISVSLGNLSTEPGQATPQMSKASVTLNQATPELRDDFVLQILFDKVSAPKAVLEHHPTLADHRALMATFIPRFNLKTSSPEIVFIADQSGSMRGAKNQSLVGALTTFLKSLPIGVRFNICSFGTTNNFLWETSQAYTANNVSEALAYVQTFNAHLGGTEMLPAFQSTFRKHLEDLPLEIILLTDGEISREGQLIEFIGHKIDNEKVDARVFTLGIGDQVSSTLVEGVSRAGRGFSQFVAESEVIDHKVVRMLKSSLYPHIGDVSLELQYDDSGDDFEMVTDLDRDEPDNDHTTGTSAASSLEQPSQAASEQAPISMFDDAFDSDAPTAVNPKDRYSHLSNVPVPDALQAPGAGIPLFPFNRTTVFLITEGKSHRTPSSVKLRAKSSQGPLELDIPVHDAGQGSTIHHLAVRKLIQELEDGRGWVMDAVVDDRPIHESSRSDEYAEKEVVRLGLKYQVASKSCSFVATEKDGTSTVYVPNALPGNTFGALSRTRMGSSTTRHRRAPFGDSVASPLVDAHAGGLSGIAQASDIGSFLAEKTDSVDQPPSTRARRLSGIPAEESPALTIDKRKKNKRPSSQASGSGALQFTTMSLGSGALFGTSSTLASPQSASPGSGALFGAPSTLASLQSASLGYGALFGASSTPASPQAARTPLFGAGSAAQSPRPMERARFAADNKDSAHGDTEEREKTDIERVRDLIALQDFAGFWTWSATIAKALDISEEVFEGKGLQKDGATMTVLVLRFFATKMSAFEGVWEMVADKGNAWLDENTTTEERVGLQQAVQGLV